MQELYTTQSAAKSLHISAQTLRRWQREGRVRVSKTQGGHARYTKEEIERLKLYCTKGLLPPLEDANVPQYLLQWAAIPLIAIAATILLFGISLDSSASTSINQIHIVVKAVLMFVLFGILAAFLLRKFSIGHLEKILNFAPQHAVRFAKDLEGKPNKQISRLKLPFLIFLACLAVMAIKTPLLLVIAPGTFLHAAYLSISALLYFVVAINLLFFTYRAAPIISSWVNTIEKEKPEPLTADEKKKLKKFGGLFVIWACFNALVFWLVIHLL